MRTPAWILVLAAAVIATPAAAAQDGDLSVTIEARESGDCPEGQTYCLAVTEGSFSQARPGDAVQVTFVNEGTVEHELLLAPASQADPNHQETPEDAAFFEIEEIEPGESETATATIPGDLEDLYMWCAISGHEQLGMWDTVQLGSGNGTDGGMDDGDGGTQDSPLGWALGVVGLAAAGLIARREGA